MTLTQYIDKHYAGNQSAFARSQGVKRQQVAKWIAKGYFIQDGHLCTRHRKIKQFKK